MRTLRFLRLKKRIQPKFDVCTLVSYDLIAPNYSDEKNEIGEHLKDGTYRITDFGVRFLIKQRKDFMHRIFTPITVTVLTDIALHVLKWLLQLIQ